MQNQATDAFVDGANDVRCDRAARVEFLGAKSGRLKAVQKGLGKVDKADKPAAGKRFNEVKQAIEAAFATAERTSQVGAICRQAGASTSTSTVPGCCPTAWVACIRSRRRSTNSKEIMGRLGFTVAEGPEIEDEWHNFEALNIPAAHPARDPLENFYLATAKPRRPRRGTLGEAPRLLLRSQTSTVQIRVMEKTPPPVRIISLGRVYRPDTADATHYPMFHQIEGLLVDRHVTMADLKSVLRLFGMSYFEAATCTFASAPRSSRSPSPASKWTCSGGTAGWNSAGPAWSIPTCYAAVGYDPEEFTGFAFGLGVERMCARRRHPRVLQERYS